LENAVEDTSLLACLDQITVESIEVQLCLPSAPLRVCRIQYPVSPWLAVPARWILVPLGDDGRCLHDRNAGLHHGGKLACEYEMSLGVIFFLDWKSDLVCLRTLVDLCLGDAVGHLT